MVEPLLIIGVVLLAGLAFANGSNDVSKGIATLAGSGVTSYRTAILWGTAWTVVGGVLAVFISSAMVKTFNGILANASGTVQPSPTLAIAVMTGAMMWVLFASKVGLPVSTTHAIVGGLCGVGLAAKGWDGTAAANLGLPVSTTHVSASAIIGMGLRKGIHEVRWKTVWEMFAAWILTLPIAGLLSAVCWSLLSRL